MFNVELMEIDWKVLSCSLFSFSCLYGKAQLKRRKSKAPSDGTGNLKIPVRGMILGQRKCPHIKNQKRRSYPIFGSYLKAYTQSKRSKYKQCRETTPAALILLSSLVCMKSKHRYIPFFCTLLLYSRN